MKQQLLRTGLLVLAVVLIVPLGDGTRGWADEDEWRDFRPLVGKWQGEGSGFGVVSDVTHEWEFVIDGKFLRLKTVSIPRTTDGAEEEHEDVGYLSLDTDRGVFVFRQFLSEGFVNTYDVVVTPHDTLEIVFEHRHAESAGGMRARLLLDFITATEYKMVLELAAPGKEFSPCQEMRLNKVN
jgi:hypothetical protein